MAKARKGAATPGERLAAQKPKRGARGAAKAAPAIEMCKVHIDASAPRRGEQIDCGVGPAQYFGLAVSAPKVRFKWVVRSKAEVPVAVGDGLVTIYHVHLEAAYEPLSILDGQATVQGNEDNRAFGTGVPKATMVLEIVSKAIADTFVVGRAQHSVMTPVEPAVRALY